MTTIEILKASAQELQRRADEHHRLIAAVVGENDVRNVLKHVI
jgi:hypothetical protein